MHAQALQAAEVGLSVASRVIQIVSEDLNISVDSIDPENNFTDLGADSLDTIELVMAFEDEFGIEIPDEVHEKWTTVQHAIDYITKLQ